MQLTEDVRCDSEPYVVSLVAKTSGRSADDEAEGRCEGSEAFGLNYGGKEGVERGLGESGRDEQKGERGERQGVAVQEKASRLLG